MPHKVPLFFTEHLPPKMSVQATDCDCLLLPPRHDVNLLSDFYDLMPIIPTSHDQIILLSDFNLHVNDHTDSRALDFSDLVVCLNLVQHVQCATHIHASTLDLIITQDTDVDISSIAKVPSRDCCCEAHINNEVRQSQCRQSFKSFACSQSSKYLYNSFSTTKCEEFASLYEGKIVSVRARQSNSLGSSCPGASIYDVRRCCQ